MSDSEVSEMSDLPHFETDAEVEAWFDDAELTLGDLEPELGIDIGRDVTIVLDEPWSTNTIVSSAPSGVITPEKILA